MRYPSYLIHFNPRHNPKTGRFDFALGPDKMEKYHGQTKSDYKKSMTEKYEGEGNSSFKSKRLASYASKAQANEVRQYNNNLRAYKSHAKKAIEAYNVGNEKKYNKEYQKLIKSFEEAKVHEIVSNRDVELGKIFYKSLAEEAATILLAGGVIGGAVYGATVDAPKFKQVYNMYGEAREEINKQTKK